MVYEPFLRNAYIQEISKGYSIDLTIDNFKTYDEMLLAYIEKEFNSDKK